MIKTLALGVAVALLGTSTYAENTKITEDMQSASFQLAGKTYLIERDAQTAHQVSENYHAAERMCPPFCLQPIKAAEGVETIGELELISFLENQVSQGKGLLIDSRLPTWFEQGTIPGAVNLPFSTIDDQSAYQKQILEALGATFNGAQGDFSNVIELALFCNGPWCGQATKEIEALINAGYPAAKLKYYHGGLEGWLAARLSIVKPGT